MRVPNAKPMPLTLRERVLREVVTLQGMATYLRTKGLNPPKSHWHGLEFPLRPAAKRDPEMLFVLDDGSRRGRDILGNLDRRPPAHGRPDRDVAFFFDLCFAIKWTYFGHIDQHDDYFPI